MKKEIVAFLFVLLVFRSVVAAQFQDERDKCGYPDSGLKGLSEVTLDHWGYGYDDLLSDINRWTLNGNIQILNIGQSTQNRNMYELMITNFNQPQNTKHRIYIHARTHPNEIQSFYVCNQIIQLLSEDSSIGKFLRDRCIFHIVPMYNPDGVELGYSRENAHNIDIESNWSKVNPEIEVVNLRNRLNYLMTKENQVEIALNLHSAYACKRYFVYHLPAGTSESYAAMEQNFINGVKSNFSTGIESWNYYVSWSTGTPTGYPESWWWLNFGSKTLALTYEDMNCTSAGEYDVTANAILLGISKYLNLGYVADGMDAPNSLSIQLYPNPFVDELHISNNSNEKIEAITMTDLSGRVLYTTSLNTTESQITLTHLPTSNGIFILYIRTSNQLLTYKLSK